MHARVPSLLDLCSQVRSLSHYALGAPSPLASHACSLTPSRLARNHTYRTHARSALRHALSLRTLTLSSPLPSHLACAYACPLSSLLAGTLSLSLSSRPLSLSLALSHHAWFACPLTPFYLSTPSHLACMPSHTLSHLAPHLACVLSLSSSQTRPRITTSHCINALAPSLVQPLRLYACPFIHALSHIDREDRDRSHYPPVSTSGHLIPAAGERMESRARVWQEPDQPCTNSRGERRGSIRQRRTQRRRRPTAP